jgi:CheY-like chemotaxis protein
MAHELVSFRLGVVSNSLQARDLFRQAALATEVPIEIVATDAASSAKNGLNAGADVLYIDGDIPAGDIAQTVTAARAGRNPAFTVLLKSEQAGVEAFGTDGLADKPRGPEETKGLLERSLRVRLPTRVLVVDDSAVTRTIVRKLLLGTRLPLEVSEAAEGFAALDTVRDSGIDIVFVDYNMPGFSGLETIAEFKRQKQRVYVVLITAMSDETLAARAQQNGAGFLKKPFYLSDVAAALCPYYGLRALNPARA